MVEDLALVEVLADELDDLLLEDLVHVALLELDEEVEQDVVDLEGVAVVGQLEVVQAEDGVEVHPALVARSGLPVHLLEHQQHLQLRPRVHENHEHLHRQLQDLVEQTLELLVVVDGDLLLHHDDELGEPLLREERVRLELVLYEVDDDRQQRL